MATFLLTWNPDGPGLPESRLVAGRRLAGRWGVGVRRSGISAGDRAFLLRQHRQRGIVAAGLFTGEIYPDEHWNGSGRVTTYADVAFDEVPALADRLPVDLLRAEVPGVAWNHLQGSGVRVRPPHDRDLEELWRDHLRARRSRAD
jgi:5-methylcytosine-specific restriction enzyme A